MALVITVTRYEGDAPAADTLAQNDADATELYEGVTAQHSAVLLENEDTAPERAKEQAETLLRMAFGTKVATRLL